MRKRKRRVAVVMREVWGIGKKSMGEELGKKNVIIRYIDLDCDGVWCGSVGLEGEEINGVQERYRRWTGGRQVT